MKTPKLVRKKIVRMEIFFAVAPALETEEIIDAVSLSLGGDGMKVMKSRVFAVVDACVNECQETHELSPVEAG